MYVSTDISKSIEVLTRKKCFHLEEQRTGNQNLSIQILCHIYLIEEFVP